MERKYGIGLDIGIGSVGYAVISKTNNLDARIEDIGVRLFNSGENIRQKASNAQERRGYRSTRRLLRRRKHRKERIKKFFLKIKLMNEMQLKAWQEQNGNQNVLQTRIKGLNEKLTPEEILDCIIHICNRRGYREFYGDDSKKDNADKDELQKIEGGLANFDEIYQSGGYKSVAEMLINAPVFKTETSFADYRNHKNAKRYILIKREFVKKELEDIFSTYDFEQIIYFSNYLTFHGETRGEAEMLRKILQLCRGKRNMRIVYLTGPERLYDVTTGKTLLVSEMENLSREYAKLYKTTVKIIRSPYLYSEQYEKDFLNTVFREISAEQKITFQEDESQRMFFLSMQDLAELIYKIFDNWDEDEEILNIADGFDHCFKDLGDKLTELCPHLKVSYARYSIMENMLKDDKIIRYKYGWFPKISILEELPELYEHYQERNNIKEGRLDSLKHIISKHKAAVRVAEFAAFFILFELLNGIAGNQAQFKMIDLRLIFVVLFGSTYGINYGIAAAAAESLSLIRAFEAEGSSWYVLFYEPSNWIPFIFYFAVGAICGYIRMKNKDNVQFIKEENNLLQEKFLFTREMYQETIEDKNLYKKQILGSKDSFGKIFDITRKLDVIQPQELYIETIRVLEDVLENKTFGLYTLNRENGYGRLETASAQVQGNYPNSIKLSEYSAAMEELENIGKEIL